MARPLSTADTAIRPPTGERRLARSAARAFAAALSVLLVATLVIDRSTAAVRPSATAVSNSFESGTIELTDDDAGRSLFQLSDMAPGRPAVRCISVVYEGSILPVELRLQAEAVGELTPFLDVTVERGVGGTFDSCEGFRPTTTAFDGTLEELAQLSRDEPAPVGSLVSVGETMSFRFTFDLADDQRVLGKQASATFLWEAVPA